jgi:hypothetical protein
MITSIKSHRVMQLQGSCILRFVVEVVDVIGFDVSDNIWVRIRTLANYDRASASDRSDRCVKLYLYPKFPKTGF